MSSSVDNSSARVASSSNSGHTWLGHIRLLDLAFFCSLAIGAFLRLFQINATQFWNDGAGTYNLAYDVAALQGVPVTGIHSSIGTFTPPGAVYVYLLPALLGSPTLGSIETALAGIGAIALVYYVCRLYLNSVIGLMAALFFSVSAGAVAFSRFIWQPNMQVPLVALLIAALLAGVVGRLRGWLAWALPFWGLLMQMHPVTASLIVLIIVAWIIAPDTVRLRDLVIGGIVAIALYIPIIVYEIMTGFPDIHLLLHAAGSKPTIGLTVFHRILEIDSLFQLPTWASLPLAQWANWPIIRALNFAWEALLICGLCYLALRVVLPVIKAIRRSSNEARWGATTWREKVSAVLAWTRGETQSRWRADLILALWPTVIILAQIRHSSPIVIHYVIPIFPAQFIALAIMLYDLGRFHSLLKSKSRLVAAGAISAISLLLAVACITQIVGTTAGYLGPQPRTLQAEIAGLVRAQSLARQYHVDFAIFQLDYQTVAPTYYMLQTSYPFPVATQIVASGSCLAGPPANTARVLYLMTGSITPWESILTQIPGVHDLMGNVPAGDYYRAYVVSPDQVAERLNSLSTTAFTTQIAFGDTSNTVVADRVLQLSVPGQSASALAIETHLVNTPPSRPFDLMYGLTATMGDSTDQAVSSGSAYCNITPWTLQQKVYYMIPQVTLADRGSPYTLSLSAGNQVYDAGDHLSLGSLHLISAYDLTSVEYIASPTAAKTFQVQDCGNSSVVCSGADKAVVHSG